MVCVLPSSSITTLSLPDSQPSRNMQDTVEHRFVGQRQFRVESPESKHDALTCMFGPN
jgi:hypothetical protein